MNYIKHEGKIYLVSKEVDIKKELDEVDKMIDSTIDSYNKRLEGLKVRHEEELAILQNRKRELKSLLDNLNTNG